ncbi:(2Fe-2S)-binding protein [Alicyclobacillus acidoterrestris]|nr:(2Fe-2S)-binding protein [Alicyclobacillus acidoterrestris]
MKAHHSTNALPEESKPFWREGVEMPTFSPLDEDIHVDVAIVGGGITGVTAAYLLIREGVSVALLEADRLLCGSTGHTTAKLTAQHNLFYDELISHGGLDKAQRYYESNQRAIDFVQSTATELNVDCEFQFEDAYVFATTAKSAQRIEKEYQAYQKLQIPGDITDTIPLHIPIHNAIRMSHQAQFHPLKFLAALVHEIQEKGARIFEQTVAVDVTYDNAPAIITRTGHRVTARKILACSHYPFYSGQGYYFARMYAERAYVLAAKTKTDYPAGMYICAESPARSLRSARVHGEPVVLITGDGHRTGQGPDTFTHYKNLQAFGEQVFGAMDILYRWSNQDLYTLDKIPYIGEIANVHPNVLVATGYKKWGMSSGIVAAHILRDLALGRDNPYADLYHPGRFYADPSLRKFLMHNGTVTAHLIKGKLQIPAHHPDDLVVGEGSVVTYNGHRTGAYKDEQGTIYLVDTTCTHMGCEVNWNHAERTWDCPCHGSRFTYTGDVVQGPAKKPLERLDE